MNDVMLGPLELAIAREHWPLAVPFVISARTFDEVEVLVLTLSHRGIAGHAEAFGTYFLGETVQSMVDQLESVRCEVERGLSRASLQGLLPPGGARNALDCAYWELEARVCRRPVWNLVGVPPPRPVSCLVTCGAGEPREMAETAQRAQYAKAIKLKLLGDTDDAARVRAVRLARPDAWLSVDANQGLTRENLIALIPSLVAARVSLIEQPFPVGAEAEIDRLNSPIPFAADESVRHLGDIDRLQGRFKWLNIKLDKCGGLTEALAMISSARTQGLRTWVGCMFGTSLAMAPAFIAGQLADFVELDAPLFLARDRSPAIAYAAGSVSVTPDLWGATANAPEW